MSNERMSLPPMKPCPIMIAATNYPSPWCIGKECAWWCGFADDCAVPLIAGILADSTVCQNVWNRRAGESNE